MDSHRMSGAVAPVSTASAAVPSPSITSIAGLVAIVKNDVAKVGRFVAVTAVMVPTGLVILWAFLQTSMSPSLANLCAVSVSTIPNYLLNRYWVWQKSGKNSVTREIAPFWAMAFLGLAISTLSVWVADRFTDHDLVFLVVNFFSFGVVWMFKFFIIERFLFGQSEPELAESMV